MPEGRSSLALDHIHVLPDGRKLAYMEVGEPDGSPIFHMHGWPGSRCEVRLARQAAREAGVRLIGVDGTGKCISPSCKKHLEFMPRVTVLCEVYCSGDRWYQGRSWSLGHPGKEISMDTDQPIQARGSATEAVEHLQAALAQDDLYELKFDMSVSLEAIQEVEQELKVQFPRSYIDLMTTYGPFAICEQEEDFEDGLYRLFTLDEIIDLTLENRELYLEDYFDPDEDEDLIEVFTRLVFFQFADYPWVENYYGFYRAPEKNAVVLRMDHDDVELLLDQGVEFDDHMWNLVEEILSEGEE